MEGVRGHRSRKIVGLIHAVERTLKDSSDLGDTGAIKKTVVTKSIETKLPENLKKEWLVCDANKGEGGRTEKERNQN